MPSTLSTTEAWIPTTTTNDEWEELGMVISMQSTMSKKILLLDAGVYQNTRNGHNLKIKYPFVALIDVPLF